MKEMISIVAAMDVRRGIGKNNDLLFRLKADFERMRSLTRGHPLVMGRKTFESIGRVLPERTSIVVSRDKSRVERVPFYVPEVRVVSSLADGIEEAKKSPGAEEIFIFGGGEIFREALEEEVVDKLYLTEVEGNFDADVFFPDYSQFAKVLSEESGEENGIKYKYIDLEK